MKKYILTKETKVVEGVTLHRIKAIRNFANVCKGELGGWIEKESNLSHDGRCWVYEDGQVFGTAMVYGDALVFDNARVYENAKVYGAAEVHDYALVFDNARVYGNAWVFGDAQVYGKARVHDYAWVHDDAKVYGEAKVNGKAVIRCDAMVGCDADYQVCKNNWSSDRYFTYTRSNDNWAVGCFNGNGKELIKKAYAENYTKGNCYKIAVEYVESLYKAMQ